MSMKEVVKEVASDVVLDVAVNSGMQAIRDTFGNKVKEFAGKGIPENRVEMFYAILLQFADEYGTTVDPRFGESKQGRIIRRYRDRENREPRRYGDNKPYEPLAAHKMVVVYVNNKRFLQEKEHGEDFLAWLDKMTCLSDEEHDAFIEAYEDDKLERILEVIDEALEPVAAALDKIPGSDSADIFGVVLPENASPRTRTTAKIITCALIAVLLTFGIWVLSY